MADAGPFAGTVGKSSDGKASYLVQIPLEKFHPGRYTLQVNVLDPAHDRVAFARVPMAIVARAATPCLPAELASDATHVNEPPSCYRPDDCTRKVSAATS